MTFAGKRLTATAMVITVGAIAFTGVWGSAGAQSTPSRAARLVAQMRDAAGTTDFSGVVDVTWRAADGQQKQTIVDVKSVSGVVEVTSRSQTVLDDGGRTFLKGDLGWSSVLGEPAPDRLPSPDAHWKLELRSGSYQGRDATAVVASRSDGTVAQRLLVDDETHLPLAREVLAKYGTVRRSFEFIALLVGDGGTTSTVATMPSTSTRAAKSIDDVPQGYVAPDEAGAGYRLISRSQHEDGVRLVYSDGMFSVSVLEQRGELDWAALPIGGTTADLGGTRARRYVEPMGDVLVWERDGVVFTCVSDAPTDVFDAMLAGLSPDPSVPERVVDFVLGPFGFS